MKPKTMILMAVAVGCGLVASYLTSKVLADRREAPEQVATRKVLTAKKNLPLGTVIKDPEKYFELKEVPENIAPKKGFESYEQIKNQKLVKPVSEDAFVTKDDIQESGTDSFTVSIPPGHRAVAMKVTPETLAGGFVQPNTRVDVLTTIRRDGQESYSQVILQNMLVLATDQEAGRSADNQAKLANTVTLAAKPEEALKLTLAGSMGELRLVLRKYGEEDVMVTKPFKFADIGRASQENDPSGSDLKPVDPDQKLVRVPVLPEPPKVEEKKVEDKPKTWKQMIINGDGVTTLVRREDGKDDDIKVEKTDPLPRANRK